MSRMVSIRLPVGHSPTTAPNHSRLPVRAVNTPSIGPRSALATPGGTFERKALTPAMPSSVRPKIVAAARSEEHTSELQSLMRISYAVFCLKKKKHQQQTHHNQT